MAQKTARFGFFLAFGLAAATLAGPGREPISTHRPNPSIMLSAHRGVSRRAPENTLPAIEKAIAMGYDYVEMDVRFTRDGVPVLMHDGWVTRTTGGLGPIDAYTLPELKRLDAGWWRGDFGTRVPTAEEAFQVMRGKIKLYLDMKVEPRPELIELLRRYDFLPDNMVVCGPGMKRFLELAPDAPVMPGLDRVDDLDELLQKFPTAVAVDSRCGILTPELIDAAHAHGLMVFSDAVNIFLPGAEGKCMRRPLELGADLVQIDNPDTFFRLRAEYRK